MKKVFKWIALGLVTVVIAFVLLNVIGYFTGFVEIDANGAHSEYAKLSADRKERVQEAATLDSLKADGNVYRVMPAQVKQYLKGKGKALVYSYIPYCSGSDCTPAADADRMCAEAGVELVLISELYYKLFENTADYPRPVFVINHEAYGTDDREKYVRMFYNGLVGAENWNRYFNGGLYFCFNRGRYLKQCKKIEEALEFLQQQR